MHNEEHMILPLPRLHLTARARHRPVAVEPGVPELSLVPIPIGIAVHALPMPLAALIHLPLVPGITLLDLDLRSRIAHITSHQPLPQTLVQVGYRYIIAVHAVAYRDCTETV